MVFFLPTSLCSSSGASFVAIDNKIEQAMVRFQLVYCIYCVYNEGTNFTRKTFRDSSDYVSLSNDSSLHSVTRSSAYFSL